MKLFDEMPRIAGDRVLLREFEPSDAPALDELARCDAVYRFEPTFLYERKYEDAQTTIARMREECFDTKESLLLAVCPLEEPTRTLGIAEIYAYEARRPKASIGYRFLPAYWGQGLASETAGLLKRYLLDAVGMRTITAHVLCDNAASARVLEKNGFARLYTAVPEDWGWDKPVLVDKFVYKRRWGNGGPTALEYAAAAQKAWLRRTREDGLEA